jgi:RNA polymerase sigma-70 factor (ECF subfamily)
MSARNGDLDSLGELIEPYRKYLKTLARLRISRSFEARVDASDLVQDAFLRAHQNFHQFRGSSEVELIAWLRKIFATGMLNAVRHHSAARRNVKSGRQLDAELEQSSADLDRAFCSRDPTASEVLAKHEHAVMVANAIEDLPEDYRSVILLHHVQGRPYAEVAQVMGRTTESIRKLWIRALAQLKRTLDSRV